MTGANDTYADLAAVAVKAPSIERTKATATATTQDSTTRDPMSSSPSTDLGLLAYVKVPTEAKRISTASGTVISYASSTVTGAFHACSKPGFHTLPEARLSPHMQGQAPAPAIASSLHGSTIQPDALAVDSLDSGDTLATDVLAAEALDATDGAFTTVADAIEVGLDSMTPSGFDSYVPTADSTVRKPGFQTASKAPLAMHIQAPTPTAAKGLDYNASTVDSTAKCARSASLGGGQCVQTPALAAASSPHGSTSHPEIPALGSGSRSSTVSAPRREPHPFLTTENARAYAQDPRMEGLLIAIDEEYPSEIQNLPWDVFLTPWERGASLQEEYMAAHYAANSFGIVDPGFPFRLTPMSFALRVTNSP